MKRVFPITFGRWKNWLIWLVRVGEPPCFHRRPCAIEYAVILLVENEVIARYAFADALRREGHQVIEAEDGAQALSLFEKSHFDLVITDLIMPRINGFELIAQIRRKSPQMPILLISAYLSEEGGRIISDGSAEFLHKPVDSADLIAAVQRLLPRS
jgi:two-component system OmpR family response regulator